MKEKKNECEPFSNKFIFNDLEFYDLITNVNFNNEKYKFNLLEKENYFNPYHKNFCNDNQQCLIDLNFIDKENLIIISPLYRVNYIIYAKLLINLTLINSNHYHEIIKYFLTIYLNSDEGNDEVIRIQNCIIKNEVNYISKKINSSLKYISNYDKIVKIENYINFFKVIIQLQNSLLIDIDADKDFTSGLKEYNRIDLKLNDDENITKNFNKILSILNSFLDVGLNKIITKLITKQKNIKTQIDIRSNAEFSNTPNEKSSIENYQLKLKIITHLKTIQSIRQLNTILIYSFCLAFKKELEEESENNQVIIKRKLIENLLIHFEIEYKIEDCKADAKNVDIEHIELNKILISNRQVNKDIQNYIAKNKKSFQGFLKFRKKVCQKND